jgi:uncharacterized protein (DUF885 family)
MRIRDLFLLLAIILVTAPALSAAELSAANLDTRRKALSDLLHEQWEYTLRTAPELASAIGDKRYNDRLSDLSPSAVQRDLVETRRFLGRFRAIDTRGFSDTEALNARLMIDDLSHELEDAHFRNWEMPVNQMTGTHLRLANMVGNLSFDTVKDYDDFLARMRLFPSQLDNAAARMRLGMKDHLMPPRFLLGKVADQAERIGKAQPDASPFARPLAKFPDGISQEDRERLRQQYESTIAEIVNPAYLKFAQFVRTDYAPKGRTDVGLWSLPDGDDRYANRAKRSTTTNLTPEEIHEIGLREVARIDGQMLEIARGLGFNDIVSFRKSLEANPALKARSRQDLLDLYRMHIDEMWAELPKLFGRLPKAKLVVEPVEAYREATDASASYESGTPDGSRPGRVMVNTGDATSRKIITVESTSYHEGVPGHHMQIAIAQELTDLPPFRQHGGNTAYVEGWALYAERLGKDIGFYKDPYSNYGRLQDEMLRAIRLVVDTGLHYKRWNREQVVQFFHDHSATDEVEVQSETDRYIAWPGQALGYKIGQLQILDLRERARRELGSAFDIRAFHDQILGAGSLPMEVLAQRIDAWIATTKKGMSRG